MKNLRHIALRLRFTISMNRKQLTEQHSRRQSILFRIKTSVFSFRRSLQNAFGNLRRHQKAQQLIEEPVIVVSESELWNANDNPQNWILTAGKVHNLRIAAQQINGLEIPAGKTFSFWKHIGNPNLGKGYVEGREIREGCIVPTKAGGLCQLSNALYDAALKAQFEIVERHRHTQVIQGSLAEQNRDATVKWNYDDLRFRSPKAFRIEAELLAEKLVIRFKSKEELPENDQSGFVSRPVLHLNDCLSCGNTACYQHPTGKIAQERSGITAFVLDEPWPEYEGYIQSVKTGASVFLIPVNNSRLMRTNRYNWKSAKGNRIFSANAATFRRSLAIRLSAYTKANVFRVSLQSDKRVAKKLAVQIPVDCTHLVVSQNLLPFLWRSGALGGRTFDVLMTRLPMEMLHQRLDNAHKHFPESPTLNDFRAPDELVQAENAALTRARRIVTPHAEIAAAFNNKSVLLHWKSPDISSFEKGTQILFPASSLGRKGAYEMKRLVRELRLPLAVYGQAIEALGFWEDLPVSHKSGLDGIGMIVFPTYVEHQPRLLLRAIARGIPVITTTASGLHESGLVTVIPTGDYDALKMEVSRQLTVRQHLTSD